MECCFVRVLLFLAFILALNVIFCSPVCQHHGSHFKHSHDPKDTSHNTSHEHRISRRNMNSFSIENSISINRNHLLYGTEDGSNSTQAEYFRRNEGTIRIVDFDESAHENCTDCHINTKHFGCMCALFTTKYPSADDVPLVSKTFQNVSCHEHISGEDACTEVCISFAMSYYEVRDIMLCTHAYNATNLTGYLQTKVCADDSNWVFTGLSNSTPLCCSMGQVVECNNEITPSSRK